MQMADNVIDGGMVIVGAGETGARAARALREEGWDGAITLIGEEAHPPYERPPLSKDVIKSIEELAPKVALSIEEMADLSIDHLPRRCAVGIDRDVSEVRLDDGMRVGYHRLLLATGAEARRLPLAGEGAGRVLYLRRHDEALAIRNAFGPGKRAIIIGGGFIGLELAASAAERGAKVTLLEAAPRILTRGVPAELAELLAARHRAAGVDLRTNVRIERVDNDAVVLADGSRVPYDVAVAGVGAVPRTDLAEAAGLAVENGIKVDATLMTEDPNIFAAGDCCCYVHPLYDGRRLRLEAWRNAHDQGALVARNMQDFGEEITAVPWFWSDQYELCLQIAGLADAGTRIVSRDLGEGAVLLFHLAEDGRLVAASGLGNLGRIGREIRLAEMLIDRRAKPDPAQLADPEVKLKALVKG